MSRTRIGGLPIVLLILAGSVQAQDQPAVLLPPDSTTDSLVPAIHEPVLFSHDQFFLEIAHRFSAASLGTDGDVPGRLGLESDRLAYRLPGVGFRRNSVPYQAGELYWQGGSGEQLGIRADRMAWEGEPLGLPPSGADDPVMLPGPHDSAYLFPTPMLGYSASELVLWRDPVLPDSAKAVARYTNGPLGFSYTGGRFRAEIGAGWETDAQVYRIFSDGTQDSSRFDGHNLDMELRRHLGRRPLRIRFRQNRANRDQLFRWQTAADRSSHTYLLSHLTVEIAHPGNSSEWLLAYDMRLDDQETKAVPPLTGFQYWFNRQHRIKLSRIVSGRLSRWFAVSGKYRETDEPTALPGAWSGEVEGGAHLSGSVLSLLVAGAAGMEEGYESVYRGGITLKINLFRHNSISLYAGSAREAVPLVRRYLPLATGSSGYSVQGRSDLAPTQNTSVALSWRHDGSTLRYSLIASTGRSRNVPVWQPSGDSASTSSSYTPVLTDRDYSGLAASAVWRPFRVLELEGGYRYQADMKFTDGTTPAYSPQQSWQAAIRFPLYFAAYQLELIPQANTFGARGGSLPADWATYSVGVEATLKHFTFFWHRENLVDEVYSTGGAYPAYGLHSRFGFRWNFWN